MSMGSPHARQKWRQRPRERLMAVWTGGSAHVHFLAGLYPHCLLSHPHFERVLVLNELLGQASYTCFSLLAGEP